MTPRERMPPDTIRQKEAAMPRDPRHFITVTTDMPENFKVEALSDKAFRLLVETWCYCRRGNNDGHIKAATWSRRGTPSSRRELVEAGLFDDDLQGGVIVHDWDQHQLTSVDIAESKERNSRAGKLGGHNQWHVGTGKKSPTCEYCYPASNGHGPPIAGAMTLPMARDLTDG